MTRFGFGTQQHKSGITSHERASTFPERVRPTNPGVARTEVESGAGPTQQRDPLPVQLDHIPERFTHHAMLFEIVMLLDQLIPTRFVLGIDNQFQSEFVAGEILQNFANYLGRI
jgi:hypothetical protein